MGLMVMTSKLNHWATKLKALLVAASAIPPEGTLKAAFKTTQLWMHYTSSSPDRMTASNSAVAAAFFAVANDPNSLSYRDKWVPTKFWTSLVKKRLQIGQLNESKLRKSLEAVVSVPLFNTGCIRKLSLHKQFLKQRTCSVVQTAKRRKTGSFCE